MTTIYKVLYEFCRYGTYIIYEANDTFEGVQIDNKSYSHDNNHNDTGYNDPAHNSHNGDGGDSGTRSISSVRASNSHSNSYDTGRHRNDKYVVHNNKVEKNDSYDIRDGDNGYHNHNHKYDDDNKNSENSKNNNNNGKNSKNSKSNKPYHQEYYTKEFEYGKIEEGVRSGGDEKNCHFSDEEEERRDNSRRKNGGKGEEDSFLDGDNSEDSEDDCNGYNLHIQERKLKIELK